MLRERFHAILGALKTACLEVYGDRLLSAAIFGSVARGTMRRDSDIDLLLVVDELPAGRMPRVREFEAVSHWLRKERELSFYDDVDFIPTEQYSAEDADRAITDALYAFEAARQLIENHA